MNSKIAVSILMLLVLSWPSVGSDCIYLGSGIRDQVINLDAGEIGRASCRERV